MGHNRGPRRPVYEQPKNATPRPDTEKQCRQEEKACVVLAALKDRIDAFLKKMNADDKRDDDRYVIKEKREKLTLWWIGGYTVITALLLVVSTCQTRIAYQTEVSAGRAWLYPENFTFDLHSMEAGATIAGDNKNVGKEPATGVLFSHFEYGEMLIDATKGPEATIAAIPSHDMCIGSAEWLGVSIEKSHTLPNQSVIFPDEPLSYRRQLFLRMDRGFFDALNYRIDSGNSLVYVRDCVSYWTFHENHTTAFCFYVLLDPVSHKRTTYHCPEGNRAN